MLGPFCKQKACAAVRVENEEPYIVLAQCLRVILVHVPVGGLLISDGPAKHAQHLLEKELHRIKLASPCHTTRSVHARYTCYLPSNTHTYIMHQASSHCSNTPFAAVYIQLPIEEEAKPPSLHAKKLPLPSQRSSYTPLHALEPCFKQSSCAAVRVENEPTCFVLAQRLFDITVQESEKPSLAGGAFLFFAARCKIR